MTLAHPFALALAAAVIDVTLGWPQALARRIGAPTDWLTAWGRLVRAASEEGDGRVSVALYLGPVAALAAFLMMMTPAGPFGFLMQALLVSAFYGRQGLDARARAVADSWEREGLPEAMLSAESLGADEKEPRFARAAAAAVAARFADEIAGQTLFILLGGLAGAALGRAAALAARHARETRDPAPFARAALELDAWTLRPAAAAAALWLALASFRRLGRSAEATMLAALGEPARDQPQYIRRAVALYRRAAAIEIAALAVLTLGAALLSG